MSYEKIAPVSVMRYQEVKGLMLERQVAGTKSSASAFVTGAHCLIMGQNMESKNTQNIE